MSVPNFLPGDPVPWFAARTARNPIYHYDTTAGLYTVLCFFGSAAAPYARSALAQVAGPLRHHFDDERLAFFGISTEPGDALQGLVPDMLPGFRHFLDHDRRLSTLYGAVTEQAGQLHYRPFTLVMDPNLRVLANIAMDDPAHNEKLSQLITTLPAIDDHAGVAMHAPVLIVPRVFEPEFCRELIALYERHGGVASGFMRQVGDTTVGMLDTTFKKRRDFLFEEQPEYEPVRKAVRSRIVRRLVPEIKKAFQYDVSRIERYIIACYEAADGGFFRRHRDNTTKGTAHRRFACTLNLNADDYEGGDLLFPEFGTRRYRAPTGGAVIFSCSLLHEATPVTSGTRFAFLPFLYDDAASKIRAENSKFIRDETNFKQGTPVKPATT